MNTKKFNNIHEEKGITLIALIITITILLILAGVSFTMLTGENGIINKTNNTVDKTNQETAREQVQTEVVKSYDSNGNLDMERLKEKLKKNLNVAQIEELEDKSGIEFDLNGVKVHVTANGEVLLEGEVAKHPTKPTIPSEPSEPSEPEIVDPENRILDLKFFLVFDVLIETDYGDTYNRLITYSGNVEKNEFTYTLELSESNFPELEEGSTVTVECAYAHNYMPDNVEWTETYLGEKIQTQFHFTFLGNLQTIDGITTQF